MIVSLLLTMINNVADAMWVSGLGSDALAAIGIVTPIFIIIKFDRKSREKISCSPVLIINFSILF